MGNEGSKLNGLVVDKDAIDTNDFFSLYNGDTVLTETPKTTKTLSEEGKIGKLSIFRGKRNGNYGQIWDSQGAKKHAIKNLMIYRHPYILKYITTWEKSGEIYLATERVRPLKSVLDTLSDIQICLGLRTLLCGLTFLTEKAKARHLNICTASIYITENGSWRLAGFEYVWKSSEVKKTLLESLQPYRYKPAIDPDELKSSENMNTIEQYAFATLCIEILNRDANKASIVSKRNDCETPHASEFATQYCTKVLRTKKPEMRPKLAAVLLHPYFNHEFVIIHSFLFELPLKSLSEKQDFFTSLIDRLRYFNENVVAAQLTRDLLSRMVLLDPTAQLCVTPYVLRTKSIENPDALFSREAYQVHIIPHINRMFRLRDAQIRLILLEYFIEYVRLLTDQELKELILPHLLDGMNDTNEVLVAKTLRCLADLVPILGATEVLGERMRLFADGRPQAATTAESAKHWVEPRSITPVLTSGNGATNLDDGVDFMVSGSPIPSGIDLSSSFNSLVQSELIEIVNKEQQLLTEMPPRLSPDGGEDDKSVGIADIADVVSLPPDISSDEPPLLFTSKPKILSPIPNEIETKKVIESSSDMLSENEDPWSDWEADDDGQSKKIEDTISFNNDGNTGVILTTKSSKFIEDTMLGQKQKDSSQNLDSTVANMKRDLSQQINDDLSAFDIQVQKTNTPQEEKSDEFDFFKDMEPVIKSSTNMSSLSSIPSSRQQSALNGSEKEKEDEEVLIDTSRFAAIVTYNNASNDDQKTFKDFGEATLSEMGNGWDVEDVDDTVCSKNSP